MDYSKEYYQFYECFDLVLFLASEGVIKDIESVKKGIMSVYERIKMKTDGFMMPDDVDGDGKMQCESLQNSYDLDKPDDFSEWAGQYRKKLFSMVSLIEAECGDKLRELNLLRKEIVGIEESRDKYGEVSETARIKVYVSVIMKALSGDGDNADFCIRLFKYAEKIADEMPSSGSAKSITRLLDAIRDAMSKDENIRETLKKIVDLDE